MGTLTVTELIFERQPSPLAQDNNSTIVSMYGPVHLVDHLLGEHGLLAARSRDLATLGHL